MRKIEGQRIANFDRNISIKSVIYLHYRILQADIVDYVSKYFNGGRVLDLGAGNQPYRSLFDKTNIYVAVDIDSSNKQLDIVADNSTLPFTDNRFDFILCTQVLEHVSEPQKLMNEVSRVMNEKAIFLLTCPMNWELHEKPYDYFRYTFYGIKYLADQAGLELVESKEQGGAFAVAGQSILNNKKLRFKRLLTPFVNVLFGYLDNIFYDPDNTLNYIFLFKKANSGTSGVNLQSNRP